MGKSDDDLNHSYVKLPEGMGVPGGNFDGAGGGWVGKSGQEPGGSGVWGM